jgi:PTH1 family peptidyl-tRNA hydrolase
MAADVIAAKHRFGPWRARYRGMISEGVLKGRRALLLKPMTYMNESGRSVGEAVRYLKIPVSAVVVIHDELDLAPGKLRAKAGGGDAGHNGLRSITATLGADYRRVRIGIGHPGSPELVYPYVLHDFAKADRDWLMPLLDAVAEAAPYLALDDDPGFMNRVALLTKPPKPPRPKPEQKAQEKKNGI